MKQKERTFATGVPMIVSASLTDNINLSNITYSWHVDNTSTIAITLKPHYKIQFENPGPQYVGVTTNGSVIVEIPRLGKQSVNKTGTWKGFIWLKGKRPFIFL